MEGRKSCISQRHTFQNKLWAEFRFHLQHLENVCFRWCPFTDWFAQLISVFEFWPRCGWFSLESEWRAEWFWSANEGSPLDLLMLIWGMFTFLSTYVISGAGELGKVTPGEGTSWFSWNSSSISPYLSIRAFIALLKEGVSDSIFGVVIKKLMREAVLSV